MQALVLYTKLFGQTSHPSISPLIKTSLVFSILRGNFVAMFKFNLRYWLCQVLGWAGWTLLNLFIAYTYAPDIYLTPENKKIVFFYELTFDLICFIVATHLLRMVLKRINWMRFPLDRVVLMFIAGVFSTGIICYYGTKALEKITDKSFMKYERNEKFDKASAMEKDMIVDTTTYYQKDKLYQNDSLNSKIVAKIKKQTGWYRNQQGKWIYEESRKGRDFWGLIMTFILYSNISKRT